LSEVSEYEPLVAAARAVIARSGYETLKVEQVLRETGLSTRAFYRCFETKEDLVFAVLEDDVNVLVGRLRRACDGVSDPAEAVERWIEAFVGAAYDPATYGAQRFSSRQFVALAAERPAGACRLVDDVVATLASVLERTEVERPDEVAYGILQMCRAMQFDGVLGDHRPAYADAVAVVSRFARAVLVAEPQR
jgi:AcrR family transcriptional regulator